MLTSNSFCSSSLLCELDLADLNTNTQYAPVPLLLDGLGAGRERQEVALHVQLPHPAVYHLQNRDRILNALEYGFALTSQNHISAKFRRNLFPRQQLSRHNPCERPAGDTKQSASRLRVKAECSTHPLNASCLGWGGGPGSEGSGEGLHPKAPSEDDNYINP